MMKNARSWKDMSSMGVTMRPRLTPPSVLLLDCFRLMAQSPCSGIRKNSELRAGHRNSCEFRYQPCSVRSVGLEASAHPPPSAADVQIAQLPEVELRFALHQVHDGPDVGVAAAAVR